MTSVKKSVVINVFGGAIPLNLPATSEDRVSETIKTLKAKISLLESIITNNRQSVFYVNTGTFTTVPNTSWTDFTNAKGSLKVIFLPLAYSMKITGHYGDGNGRHMKFRLKLEQNNKTYYFPSQEGELKYLYTDHSRLESHVMQGFISGIPEGEYQVQLQLSSNETTGQYTWNSIYGVVQLITW